MPETKTVQATFLVQGFRPRPWDISARLREVGVQSDVRFRTRPNINGHRVILDLVSIDGEPISLALTSDTGAERLAGLAQWLCERSTAVQLLVQLNDSDAIGEYVHIPPIMLPLLLPQAIADGANRVFFFTAIPPT